MRDDYLEWINRYFDNGYEVFYQDDKWIFKKMVPTNFWKQLSCCEDDNIDYKVSTGSGQRSILAHFGSAQTELIHGYLLLFSGRKRADPDYRSKMNQDVFLRGYRVVYFRQ